MKIIVRPRGAGKTTDVIKLAAETFSYIVCPSHREACRIAEQARTMELEIPFPLTFDEFAAGQFHTRGGVRGFIVDNVDMLVSHMARGVRVHAITATSEDEIRGHDAKTLIPDEVANSIHHDLLVR